MKSRAALLLVSLFLLWLLMSGIYKTLIVGLGVVSCLLVVWIVRRLGLLDETIGPISPFRVVKYVCWLTVEIGKADWAVTKVILGNELPDRQRLIKVPATQDSDLGKTLFANSITITPGTVTVETEPDYFVVHALTDEAADQSALKSMNDRVTLLETGRA